MVLWQTPALVMIIGYLLGSIPFGIILTRIAGVGDLRQIGSGNIGATNVLRTGRKGLAAATLLLDGAKGAVAVFLGWRLMGGDALANGGAMAGLMAFLGHCYPVWLRFAGGKGVATMLGVVAALHWPVGLVFAGTWVGMLALTRISSVGGMAAAASAPVAAVALGRLDLFAPMLAMALVVLWRHRANMGRLVKGIEPRVGAKTSREPESSGAETA
ncbi:glycerol-3-phosphate 1-O-acyltransferase PlsY [Sphingobium subterraneum]|uniref:Glycerol-3-phosphate acyltransferase n=1 Tax=Sphingobium subterraneum TaxID=627688 RepID=A0A841J4W6_9SPHN|nr:glycerol-3-phosphate 1-O-acyltransferase PlsY [Sphingobium subterraneum]MBB6123281.1 glycerol-3-phosphate acyltransferase PlsY [Sphingobium subterraneum]